MKAKWTYPNEVRFGSGRIKEIKQVCEILKIGKPMIATDRGLAEMEMTQNIMKLIPNAKMFSEVDANPNEKNVEQGVEMFKQEKCDGVIALGGGSGLDAGKAIAFMVAQNKPIWEFEDKGDNWKYANTEAIKPIVAIPTTAGTGSEVGRASIITNSQTNEKKIIFHPRFLPEIVICDPELTISMPKHITAGTGLDALAHCVEAYSSPHYHPMSQGIALEGMKIIKEFLPLAYKDGKNIEARANMMAAAAMGAVAFQKGLGAIHALSHPIGAMYHTHHGTTNAVFMPYVLKFNESKIKDRFNDAANYLGIKNGFNGFCEYINELNEMMEIPKNLKELGVENPDVERIVKDALNDPSANGNPVKMDEENTRELLKQCI